MYSRGLTSNAEIITHTEKADNGVPQIKTGVEIGLSRVTLSRSECPVVLGHEMLRCGSA